MPFSGMAGPVHFSPASFEWNHGYTNFESCQMFISDGVNDYFIPGDVVNVATGEKLMSVDSVAFLLDQYLPFM